MSNGLKLNEWTLEISQSRHKALVNHFLKEVFGQKALQQEIKEYSEKEYLAVLDKYQNQPSHKTLSDSFDSASDLYDYEEEILISFIKTKLLNDLSKVENFVLKDYLSNELVIRNLFKYIS